MSQDHAVPSAHAHRRRRFRNRGHRNTGGASLGKFGAAVLMLIAIFLVIIGCITAIRIFE